MFYNRPSRQVKITAAGAKRFTAQIVTHLTCFALAIIGLGPVSRPAPCCHSPNTFGLRLYCRMTRREVRRIPASAQLENRNL